MLYIIIYNTILHQTQYSFIYNPIVSNLIQSNPKKLIQSNTAYQTHPLKVKHSPVEFSSCMCLLPSFSPGRVCTLECFDLFVSSTQVLWISCESFSVMLGIGLGLGLDEGDIKFLHLQAQIVKSCLPSCKIL